MTDTQLLKNCIPLILDWYRENRRPLPWRADPTPYQVWVSEIMLQQTRIEAALGYYARFMAALPTLEALAAVEEERLLKLWEGLGYYSRARNLKKAALLLMRDYGGALPHKASELKKLPGVGAYTAGAIASIAFGEPEPAVDGNVLRVLTRLLARGEDITLPKTRAALTALLKENYPSGGDAALLTEGIMELGETVCVPNGAPNCPACPLRGRCRACRAQTAERYPVRAPKKARRVEERTVLLLSCTGRCAFRRREEKGLLAGLWEFPSLPGRPGAEALAAHIRGEGGEPLSLTPCGAAKHIFTHVEWHMEGYHVPCAAPFGPYEWKSPDEIGADYPLPSAFRYYRERLDELQQEKGNGI